MTHRIVAIHGVPTSPALWARLQVDGVLEAPALAGLATDAVPTRWDMATWLADVRPRVDAGTVLVGHDLGGILAALLAVERPVRGLVLCATSLSPVFGWALRATAWPLAWRYFYRRHGGRRFLLGGLPVHLHGAATDTFLGAAPVGLADRMRSTARALSIPSDLVSRLRDTSIPVSLIWGRRDPWYPLPLARRLAYALGAELTIIEAGHLAPWEAPVAFGHALERSLRRFADGASGQGAGGVLRVPGGPEG